MSAPSLGRLLVYGVKRFAGPQRWAAWRARYRAVRLKMRDRAENQRWRVRSPRLLIVSEGGEARHFYWYFLDWLGRERPSLRGHIHLDRLPCRLPRGTVVVHAWVQDPVIERAPEVHAQLVRLEAACADRGVAIVHPANVLSHSKRDVLCERLHRVGLRTPRIALLDASFEAHRGGLGLPLVVRRRWGHAAVMRRLDTAAAVGQWWRDARIDPSAWVAAEYIDVRDPDGCYRKYRYVMAGARGMARHLIVSANWEVRPADRVRTPATREQELAYVARACPHHTLFDAARQALQFEIAAFDYSYDAHGGLVVWEVNPYPNLSAPRGEVGDYLRPTVERCYAMLADFYAERAGLTRTIAVTPVTAARTSG